MAFPESRRREALAGYGIDFVDLFTSKSINNDGGLSVGRVTCLS